MERVNPNHLLPLAYSFAREVYPELLRPAVNSVPLRMTWLDGFSGYSRRLPLSLSELFLRRDPGAARQAVQDDMIEGGAGLVALMGKMEAGEVALVDAAFR